MKKVIVVMLGLSMMLGSISSANAMSKSTRNTLMVLGGAAILGYAAKNMSDQNREEQRRNQQYNNGYEPRYDERQQYQTRHCYYKQMYDQRSDGSFVPVQVPVCQ